ncbi:MAG TPA: 4-oxalocrotonate tautomerase family protein [Kouleothrix sp.]|uniref:tautomerase family protein n=1 Tax=Kouleothrix sp. TaxID=2779161 RepID=UPI002BA2B6D9|nr:4-oxalocrotonate tautomerase family protein [Kouleothrix sp.]HRC76523.1 4-oxalocrotonate tautomerase family protein [Kouleothrix sp.]
MPIVRIDMLAGRTPERKADLIRRVTDAVVAALEVRPEQVRVLLSEVPPEHWAIGGETIAARASRAPTPEAERG